MYLNSYCSDKPFSFFEDRIRKMNYEIRHRGPDDEGIMINYPVSLGFQRLSIIDLSDNANQPMFNEDKSIAIIFNGEIYNYLELIPDLKSKGHTFNTRSDTEVIIHSYEEYGFDCVNKFNGMWAFAIYDFRKKILFASRDRLGVKPFYYFPDNCSFIFSSEIKAILKVKNITEANHGKVFDYLAYGYKTSNGETFFQNIYELRPAHNIIIENDKIKTLRYWDFKNETLNSESPHDKLNFLLYDSVKLRFRSDVPVSILLSGGLDSSIIAKISDELIDNGDLKNENVTAFTAVFPGFQFDESKLVKEFLQTCKHIKQFEITPGINALLDSINNFVYGMGEPVFSTTSFAHYTLMKEITKHNVKVVLNGQGSDEIFAGYDKYFIGYFLLDILMSKPHNFFSQISYASDKLKYTYKYLVSQTLKAILSRKRSSYLRSKYREKIFGVLNSDFIKNNYDYFVNPDYIKFSSSNLKEYMKYNVQYQGFNQILHYEDHSSMQSSIEMRSPFIDYRIVELAFSTPDKYKIDKAVTKKILRDLFKDKLPDSIVHNYNKIGFVTPFDNWLKEEKMNKFINEILNTDSFKNKTIIDTGKVKEVFNNRNDYPSFPFWRIINLDLWAKAYNITNL